MNPRIKKVIPLENFKLRLFFTNGEEKIYDCSPLLNFGVFSKLQNKFYFRQVKAHDGTIVWPDDQDIFFSKRPEWCQVEVYPILTVRFFCFCVRIESFLRFSDTLEMKGKMG